MFPKSVTFDEKKTTTNKNFGLCFLFFANCNVKKPVVLGDIKRDEHRLSQNPAVNP